MVKICFLESQTFKTFNLFNSWMLFGIFLKKCKLNETKRNQEKMNKILIPQF
jgi:hypothetical protein